MSFESAIAKLVYGNPFLPERIEAEREALGSRFVSSGGVWELRTDSPGERANIARIRERLAPLVEGGRGGEDLALYYLYDRHRDSFQKLIETRDRKAPFYESFVQEAARLLPSSSELPHLFAILFQIRRAFHHIHGHIVGGSMPTARLRATIWQSIFTHDLKRYRRTLYTRMGDIATLIVGPSGTGKELVARAIALSRYISFDPRARSFTDDFAGSFHPLNLSALSPTLIESELFGHRRGAFTGALGDRAGWLEVCRPLGTVFLDEVGDVDPQIQVKLLRVLQTREFQRLGDTETRRFSGKIVAATNRDLGREMQAGRFRRDFYYRLCSDMIVTPTLHEQLRDRPEDLSNLIAFVARRVAGEEVEGLAGEVETWVERHLGRGYAWPGNFRELEQCVRNILIRKEYHPVQSPEKGGREALAEAVAAGRLTADELLRRYCTLVYAQTGNFEETARRLMLDRRTVKSKVDPKLQRESE